MKGTPSPPPPGDAQLPLLRWEASAISEATLSVVRDAPARTIRIQAAGLWTPAEAIRYFDEMVPIAAEARRCFGTLRVLVDVRGGVVQPDAPEEDFRQGNARVYRPEDRIAVIVSSSLFKLRIRQRMTVGICESFISPAAAETWLQAYAAGARSA